jgi:hypothetical protein
MSTARPRAPDRSTHPLDAHALFIERQRMISFLESPSAVKTHENVSGNQRENVSSLTFSRP